MLRDSVSVVMRDDDRPNAGFLSLGAVLGTRE